MAIPPSPLPKLFNQGENVQTGDTEYEPSTNDVRNLHLSSGPDTPTTADHSTGNTPTSSHQDMEEEEDDYSPPMSMSTTFLPGHPTTEGFEALKAMIDFIPAAAAAGAGRNPTKANYTAWKRILSSHDFTHEAYTSALTYAVDMILQSKKKKMMTPGGAASKSEGFRTGWPLKTLQWEDISLDLDLLGRMSSMEIKSGILQACEALHRVHAGGAESGVEVPGGEGREEVVEVELMEVEEESLDAAVQRLIAEEEGSAIS